MEREFINLGVEVSRNILLITNVYIMFGRRGNITPDCYKAYNIIAHSWTTECMNLFRIASYNEQLLTKNI